GQVSARTSTLRTRRVAGGDLKLSNGRDEESISESSRELFMDERLHHHDTPAQAAFRRRLRGALIAFAALLAVALAPSVASAADAAGTGDRQQAQAPVQGEQPPIVGEQRDLPTPHTDDATGEESPAEQPTSDTPVVPEQPPAEEPPVE